MDVRHLSFRLLQVYVQVVRLASVSAAARLLHLTQPTVSLQLKKLADKVLKYRVFSDEAGKMNLNVQQAGGQLLVVSQFTLAADTNSGLRPSFTPAARPEVAEPMYLQFVAYCRAQGLTVATGQFGADMQVSLVNDGPVTFWLQVPPVA